MGSSLPWMMYCSTWMGPAPAPKEPQLAAMLHSLPLMAGSTQPKTAYCLASSMGTPRSSMAWMITSSLLNWGMPPLRMEHWMAMAQMRSGVYLLILRARLGSATFRRR